MSSFSERRSRPINQQCPRSNGVSYPGYAMATLIDSLLPLRQAGNDALEWATRPVASGRKRQLRSFGSGRSRRQRPLPLHPATTDRNGRAAAPEPIIPNVSHVAKSGRPASKSFRTVSDGCWPGSSDQRDALLGPPMSACVLKAGG